MVGPLRGGASLRWSKQVVGQGSGGAVWMFGRGALCPHEAIDGRVGRRSGGRFLARTGRW